MTTDYLGNTISLLEFDKHELYHVGAFNRFSGRARSFCGLRFGEPTAVVELTPDNVTRHVCARCRSTYRWYELGPELRQAVTHELVNVKRIEMRTAKRMLLSDEAHEAIERRARNDTHALVGKNEKRLAWELDEVNKGLALLGLGPAELVISRPTTGAPVPCAVIELEQARELARAIGELHRATCELARIIARPVDDGR